MASPVTVSTPEDGDAVATLVSGDSWAITMPDGYQRDFNGTEAEVTIFLNARVEETYKS